MFSKAILVVSLLFFLVEGAKYKVLNDNSRKLSKEEKFKAVNQFKEHIASVTGKAASKGHATSSSLKRIEEVKKLEAWNDYDSSFSSEMWLNTETYLSDGCSGDVSALNTEYSSFCYSGMTITGSNGEYYGSAQELFTSDCSSKTMAFYASADCSGTPTAQGNIEITGLSTSSADVCVHMEPSIADDDGIGFLSTKFSCTSSAMAWDGNGAGTVQFTEYDQTQTCSGEALSINHVAGGCYQTSDTSSIEYAEGPTFNLYETSTDCTGSRLSIEASGCLEDDDDDAIDDDDDDDDNLIDDGMFTSMIVPMDGYSSTDFAWITGVTQCLDYEMWSFKTRYHEGDTVFYLGAIYVAKNGVKFKYPFDTPNKWLFLEPCSYSCSGAEYYGKKKKYLPYDTVLYKGMLYVARKKSKGQDPATYSSYMKYRKNKWEPARDCY